MAKFTAEDLKAWYEKKILAAPRVIAIFGDVDNETAVAMAQEIFRRGAIAVAAAKVAVDGRRFADRRRRGRR